MFSQYSNMKAVIENLHFQLSLCGKIYVLGALWAKVTALAFHSYIHAVN